MDESKNLRSLAGSLGLVISTLTDGRAHTQLEAQAGCEAINTAVGRVLGPVGDQAWFQVGSQVFEATHD